jgi:tRNA A-37 threonylcarbamoyl transferase component Bud32
MAMKDRQAMATPFLPTPRSRLDLRPIEYLGWRGYATSECASPPVLDRFISIHEVIRNGEATVFQNSGGRAVAMILPVIQGRSVPVLVKEDDLLRSGVRALLKSHLRPARARVTWRQTIQLHAAGVAVQAPVALLELRRWGVLLKSVYVCGFVANAVPIVRLLRGADRAGAGRASLLKALAFELRAMHDSGFCHGDLKDGNILAERHADEWVITFIDLENVTAEQPITVKGRAIDLGRLWLALIPLTKPVELEAFLDHYASVTPGLDPGSLRRAVMRQMEALQARRYDRLPDVGVRLRNELTIRHPSAPHVRWVLFALGSAAAALEMGPLLALLRREFPTVRLELLGSREAATALGGNPDIDGIMTVSGWLSTVRSLRACRYQVAIDATDTIASALLTRSTGAGVRIGYRVPSIVSKWLKRATCYTHLIMARPEQRDRVQYYLLVGKALGLHANMFAGPSDVHDGRTL